MYIICVGATLAVARREDSAMRELAGGRISFREMLYPSPTTLGDWTDSCSRGDVTNLTVMRHSYITCVGATLAVARRRDGERCSLAWMHRLRSKQ